MIPVVNPLTGEITDVQEPNDLDEANRQAAAFVHGLGSVSKALHEKRKALAELEIEYTGRFAALTLSSDLGEAGQRKAEAESILYDVTADGVRDESLGARRDRLRIEVKLLAEKAHDYRAAMSVLQTVSSNLRTEASLRGDVWDSPAQRR